MALFACFKKMEILNEQDFLSTNMRYSASSSVSGRVLCVQDPLGELLGASARLDGAGGRRLTVSASRSRREWSSLRSCSLCARQTDRPLCDTEFFTSSNGRYSHDTLYNSTHLLSLYISFSMHSMYEG